MSRLVNLEWLNLSENLLTGPVPATLSSHTRLVELNLSANRLSGPLPPELCDMARLVSLQLSHNNLEGFLPAEVNMAEVLLLIVFRQSVPYSPCELVPGRPLVSPALVYRGVQKSHGNKTVSSRVLPTRRSLATARNPGGSALPCVLDVWV